MPTPLEFITNSSKTHKDKILGLFDASDTITIAVGFLKPSGLNNIEAYLQRFCSDKSKRVTFYVGTGLGETDPVTLQKLWRIINQCTNNKLVLCTPDAGIFHPKIYTFLKGNNVTIITGSANLTESGWVINDEVSVLAETVKESSEYKQLNLYFQNLYERYYTDDILSLINDYKNQLEQYQKAFRPAFHFRRKAMIDGIDLRRLRQYYKAYGTSKNFIDVKKREDKYTKARSNLLEISRKWPLSKQQFHDLFGPLVGHRGYEKLWHSGSIHRTTYKTLEYIPGFRKIVKLAERSVDLPVQIVYDKMITLRRELKGSNEIHGVGENILAEILMSFNPNKFANLNDNPVAVLSFLGKTFPSVSSFRGATYEEYVMLLSKIRDDLNMRSFLEVDSFFNYVYWKILEGLL